MTTLFISDLHLCAQRPAITRLFLDFLRRDAKDAEALYILGDLFEYWIGDEAVSRDEYRSIIDGLRTASSSGTPVFVMPGNRDFLMGPEFERQTGCQLLKDPTIVKLYDTQVLLMHGDSLCTDDREYQAFREVVRSESWMRSYLAKSLDERDALFREYREMSKLATAQKRPEIMDVNQQAVEAVMREHQVHDLIHGHTHRPGQHFFDLDGMRARRTVLGDWCDQGSVLRCGDNGRSLEPLPLEQYSETTTAAPAS